MRTPHLYDVYLVNLDGAIGSEMQKTRLCVITSPYEENRRENTVSILPLTTGGANRPNHLKVKVRFGGKDGFILLKQSREVDKMRLIKYRGKLTDAEAWRLFNALSKNLNKTKPTKRTPSR